MKKIVKASLLLAAVASLGVMNVNAKTMTANDIEELSKIEFGGVTSYENVYIYGKNVHINLITMSDIILSGNDMEGVKDKSLYYKNGDNVWTKNDGLKENTVNKSSVPTFEMTKLIGSLNGGHVSEETGIYDGDYVKTEDYTNGRKAEIFVDETAPLSIVDIRPVQKAADLSSQISTDTNKHNMTALDVNFEETEKENEFNLTLTENVPLLQYNNGTNKDKWAILLVKTNRPITKDDLKSKNVIIGINGTKASNSNTQDFMLASNIHGGDSNELAIFVANDTSSITLTIKDEKGVTTTQTINVTHKANFVTSFEDSILVTESESEPTVSVETEGVSYKVSKIDDKYVVVLYSNDNTITRSDIEYSIAGDSKLAKYTDTAWKTYELIQIAEKGEATAVSSSNVKWNQEAITDVTVEKHTRTDKEAYDYVVYVHHNKEFDSKNKNVSVNLDLSVSKDTINGGTQVSDSTKWTITKAFDNTELVTLKNTTLSDTDYDVVVKLEFVDDTEELSFSVDKTNNFTLYSSDNLTDDQKQANKYFADNMNNITVDTTKNENNYTVRIQQADYLEELKQFKYNSKDNNKAILVVDLGVDPTKLTNSENKRVVSDADIKLAKTLGATSDTAFTVSIFATDTSKNVTYVYSETKASIVVTYELIEFDTTRIYDKADTTKKAEDKVVIADEYKEDVQYSEGQGFILSNKMKEVGSKFVATTTTKPDATGKTTTTTNTYVFTKTECTDETNGCLVKIQNIELKDISYDVFKDANKYKEAGINYNNSAIKSVTYDEKTNTINVVFDRNPWQFTNTAWASSKGHDGFTTGKDGQEYAQMYGLIINLGVANDNIKGLEVEGYKNPYTIEAGDKNDTSIANLLGIEETSANNMVKIWIQHELTGRENGYTFKFVNEVGTDASIPFEFTIKSTVESDLPSLKLKDVTKVTVDDNIDEYLTETEMEYKLDETVVGNNEGLNASIEKNKVVITHDKPLTNGDSEDIAVLLDLGVNAKYVALDTDDATKAEIRTFTKKAYGTDGENGTKFVLLIESTQFVDGKLTLHFNQNVEGNAGNKYEEPIAVEFILKDITDQIVVKESNVSERSASETPINWSYDKEQYSINQNRLTYEFKDTSIGEAKTLEININAIKNTELPVEYELSSSKRKGNWYAITFDLGKDVSVSGHKAGVWYEEEIDFSKGQFVIWVNTASKELSDNKMTITDNYNSSTVKLTFNYGKEA